MTDPFSPAGRFEERRRDAEQQRAQERMNRRPAMTKTEEMEACPGCAGRSTRVIGGPCTAGGPKYWAGCDHCHWRTWGDTEAEALATLSPASHDSRPDLPGSPEAKIESYNQAHEVAVEMGYPSLTEALEHLDALRSTPAPDALRDKANALVERLLDAAPCDLANGRCGVPNFGDELADLQAAFRTEGKPS